MSGILTRAREPSGTPPVPPGYTLDGCRMWWTDLANVSGALRTAWKEALTTNHSKPCIRRARSVSSGEHQRSAGHLKLETARAPGAHRLSY